MATTTFGSNPAKNNWMFDGTMHQAWIGNYSTSGLGRVTRVDAYCAAQASGGTGGAVAWVGNVPSFYVTTDAMAVGSGTTGAWHAATADIPTSSGSSWQFGFYASKGVWVIYHTDGGATFVKASAISNATGGTNVSAYGSGAGSMLAYGTYFIVEMYVRRGGSWTKTFIYVWRSGSWSLPPTYVRRGGGWTQVGHLGDGIPFDPDRSHDIMYQNENGIWLPGIVRWEGPFYLGPSKAREIHLHGVPEPTPYELVAA